MATSLASSIKDLKVKISELKSKNRPKMKAESAENGENYFILKNFG